MTDTRNMAETVADLAERAQGRPETLVFPLADEQPLDQASMLILPPGRQVQDLTDTLRRHAEYLKPARRKGRDMLLTLDSLIDWANRFKGEASVVFADTGDDDFAPSLTCIANWHGTGAPSPIGRDETAQHGDHRGTYRFPVSDEWTAWTSLAGQALSKDELGEFIEARHADVLDPTPALLGQSRGEVEPWEASMIELAARIDGRFASYRTLLEMSRAFAATESESFKAVSNRDSGEGMIEIATEHRDAEGAPIKVPNLFMIAIPVFDGGAHYRLAVRLRYRLRGGLRFFLSVFNPEDAARDAFQEAVTRTRSETELPVFHGRA